MNFFEVFQNMLLRAPLRNKTCFLKRPRAKREPNDCHRFNWTILDNFLRATQRYSQRPLNQQFACFALVKDEYIAKSQFEDSRLRVPKIDE